jgi:hypothetical protein
MASYYASSAGLDGERFLRSAHKLLKQSEGGPHVEPLRKVEKLKEAEALLRQLLDSSLSDSAREGLDLIAARRVEFVAVQKEAKAQLELVRLLMLYINI